MELGTWIAISLVSLLLSGLFSGTEMAYVTADRVRTELDVKRGGPLSRIINRFYSNSELFISTILVGNNIVLVIYGMGAAALLEPPLRSIFNNEAIVLTCQTLASTAVILLIGEFLPKTVFGINPNNLPEVCDSNSNFGETDFDGLLPNPVPIHGVLGDSHGALFGQGCLQPGMMKSTYGTGSSIMMNIGENPVLSTHGVVTSLAWSMDGKVNYVLEGNLNYTGAVITWLKDDLKMIDSPQETQVLAEQAASDDPLYLVPAFSGLGAPYWDSRASAAFIGMTRTTKRAELVKAALECIAYQITDIVNAMVEDARIKVDELRVDGGPTKNQYLMQFQSDITQTTVQVPEAEELSGLGPAYAAGIALGLWDEFIFEKLHRKKYTPKMDTQLAAKKYAGWQKAIHKVITR